LSVKASFTGLPPTKYQSRERQSSIRTEDIKSQLKIVLTEDELRKESRERQSSIRTEDIKSQLKIVLTEDELRKKMDPTLLIHKYFQKHFFFNKLI